MMENRTPKSIASVTSTVRGHSPYCEATGPIVHEGFVAARVREIQAKFEETPQNLSHSPLIPCPVPHWLQIIDPITPPQSLSSGRRKTSGTRTINTKSTTLPSRSFETHSGTKKTTVAPGGTNDATDGSSTRATIKDEKMISSPKPTMPATTLQSDGWPYPYHGESFQNASADSGTPLRPLNSVADRLVSLVDRGWVGCDVFGKAYSDRRTSDNYASSEHSQKAIPGDGYSRWEISREEALPVRRCLYPEQDNSIHHKKQATNAGEFHSSPDSNVEPKVHGHRRQWGFETISESDSKVRARINSSEIDGSQASETENCRPSNHFQAKNQEHHSYFMDCQSQRSEFDKLSLSQEIDRHLSQWENTRVVNLEPSELAKLDPTDLHVDDQLQRASWARDSEDIRLDTTTTQKPKEPPIRSASWFSKLAGFKLVLVDRAPIMQVLSRRTSEPAMGSVGVQHHHQHQQDMNRPRAPPADGTKTCGDEALFAKCEPKSFPLNSDAPKVRSESTKGEHNTSLVPTTDTSVHMPGSAVHQNMPSTSDSPSRSPQVTPSLSAHNIQEHGLGPTSGEKPSESSTTRHHKEESIPASRIASTSRVAQKPEEIRSGSSNSEGVMRSNVTQVDGSQVPEIALPRQIPAVITRSIPGDVKDNKKSAQWEVAGNGRGIKRVQVIVSLDGADDLMIDAKLLTTTETDNESRIEEVEHVDSEKLSEHSCQE